MELVDALYSLVDRLDPDSLIRAGTAVAAVSVALLMLNMLVSMIVRDNH